MKWIRIHPDDNVVVALEDIHQGETLEIDGVSVTAVEDIARGHKMALRNIPEGEPVVKYGNPIGLAKAEIPAGAWAHVHNVRTGLSESADYSYCHKVYDKPAVSPRTFMGYRREDGRAAVRNEIWIVPTVGCVNSVAAKLVQDNQHLVKGSIDGLLTFAHPYGCSQMGGDHAPLPTPTAAARWAATMPRPARCWQPWCAIPTRAVCWCSASAART